MAKSVHELFQSLPAPEDAEQALLYQLAEYVFTDLHSIAETLQVIAEKLNGLEMNTRPKP